MIKINKIIIKSIKFDRVSKDFKWATFFNNKEKMVYNAKNDSFYKQNPNLIEYDEVGFPVIHYDKVKVFNHDYIKKIIFDKHKKISRRTKKENKIKKGESVVYFDKMKVLNHDYIKKELDKLKF